MAISSDIVIGVRRLTIPGLGINPIFPDISDIVIPRELVLNALNDDGETVAQRTITIQDEGKLTITVDFEKIPGFAHSLTSTPNPLVTNTYVCDFPNIGSVALSGFTGGSAGGCFEISWN